MGDLDEIKNEQKRLKIQIRKKESKLEDIKNENTKIASQILDTEKHIEHLKSKYNILVKMGTGFFGRVTASDIKKAQSAYQDIIRYQNSHETLRTSIVDISITEKEIEELKEKMDELNEKKRIPGKVWSGYPEELNKTAEYEFFDSLEKLSYSGVDGISFINLILIGETGSGKSSFLNTLSTALKRSGISDTYKVLPRKHIGGATKTLHLVTLETDKGTLPIRFFDSPGISENSPVGKEVLDMILDGEIKANTEIKNVSEMRRNKEIFREKPGPADMMHCIIYVIRATSNLNGNASRSLKVLKEIRESKMIEEDGPRQFVLVTGIDEIGVPNSDIKNVYRYPCLKEICLKVSDELHIPLTNVLPMSNYFEEASPTTPKNCMALMHTWRVVSSTTSYVRRKWGQTDVPRDFFD